jgi:hypothetical protein
MGLSKPKIMQDAFPLCYDVPVTHLSTYRQAGYRLLRPVPKACLPSVRGHQGQAAFQPPR